MFRNAKAFNQYIGDWNINAVTNMDYMFNGAISFERENNCLWNINKDTSKRQMYQGETAYQIVPQCGIQG